MNDIKQKVVFPLIYKGHAIDKKAGYIWALGQQWGSLNIAKAEIDKIEDEEKGEPC